jgi:hypothetical protein
MLLQCFVFMGEGVDYLHAQVAADTLLGLYDMEGFGKGRIS